MRTRPLGESLGLKRACQSLSLTMKLVELLSHDSTCPKAWPNILPLSPAFLSSTNVLSMVAQAPSFWKNLGAKYWRLFMEPSASTNWVLVAVRFSVNSRGVTLGWRLTPCNFSPWAGLSLLSWASGVLVLGLASAAAFCLDTV